MSTNPAVSSPGAIFQSTLRCCHRNLRQKGNRQKSLAAVLCEWLGGGGRRRGVEVLDQFAAVKSLRVGAGTCKNKVPAPTPKVAKCGSGGWRRQISIASLFLMTVFHWEIILYQLSRSYSALDKSKSKTDQTLYNLIVEFLFSLLYNYQNYVF